MHMRSSVVLPVVIGLCVTLCSHARAAVINPTLGAAVFNLNGISGWIRFYEFENENVTSIVVNLEGVDQVISEWTVHNLPVDETLQPTDRCSEAYVGGVYNPTNAAVTTQCVGTACPVGELSGRFGPISAAGLAWFNDTGRTVTLQGPQSIIGRALVLQVGTKLVCATIRSKAEKVLPPEELITMQATFISPVGGVVYFRQSGNEPTVIHGKLFSVNEINNSSVEWTIYDDLLFETYRAGVCGNFSLLFDDLTIRHGTVTVSSAPQPYSDNAFLFTDNMIKLSGISTIEGRSLVLSQGGMVIACAPIVISELLEVYDYPNFDIGITQTSPYENSTLLQSQNFKSSTTYTILNAAWMTNVLCPLSDEPYNPLGITSPGNDVVIRTPDLFSYGNITGKYSFLLGPRLQLSLPELPLYGPFSLLGLTLRAVSNTTTSGVPQRACSALLPVKDETTKMAKATFTEGSVNGAIFFIQGQDPQLSGQPGVTDIVVDIYYSDAAMSQTTGHSWNVQENVCTISTGVPYNPFNVVRGSTYVDECGVNTPLRCESGDLSGKHGQLTIGPLGETRSTFSFIDPSLQLDGQYRIVGKSLEVHMPGGSEAPLLACAEIKLVKPNDAQYDIVVSFPETSSFERVTFTKQLVEMASLDGKVDPSDLLVLHEEVGMTTVGGMSGRTACATTLMKVTAPSLSEANRYAMTLQNAVCTKFADNGCMAQLTNFNSLCGAVVGSNGQARPVASLLNILLLVITFGLLMAMLHY